ncbi:hypothetical protein HDF26_002849 [Pedobacter cryoconitis]|uniref:carboxypeptidase-like regulatory domain-containing protein n=1 Tax=Pedobacter cryoconitis TaxID=188932 RepID=UPI00160FF4F4|nr:carboxypeptidase-like regulatory domain-containing protein [Pedobacter cryoconitis]MBB6272392.1 hypothetical protein [Pedobacter cryoconitis]
MLILCLNFWAVKAQDIEVSGMVSFSDGGVAPGVTIVIKENEKMLSYHSTMSNGSYKFKMPSGNANLLLFKSIGYKTTEVNIKTLKITDQKHASLDVTLQEDAFELKGIVIQGDGKKERDTVALNLDKMNLTENSKFREILSKSPNFRLEDDGSIFYKGKPIDKILLNNRPGFVNQNSVALESIEKRMIEGIKIINNYKNNFSLNFDEVEETVLNIDTKEGFKNIIKPSFQAGYGYDNKYNFQGEALYFGNQLNSFLTTHTNNIGKMNVNLREIDVLLRSQESLSVYQQNVLNELLIPNKNRLSDFSSSTNYTFRKETPANRINATVYYFNTDRTSSLFSQSTNYDGSEIFKTNQTIHTKGNTLLSNIIVDFKMKTNQILSYQFGGNLLRDKGFSPQESVYGGVDSIHIFSAQKTSIGSMINKVNYDYKVAKNLILGSRTFWYTERSAIPVSASTDQQTIFNQDLVYRKNNIGQSIFLRYKQSEFFSPSLELNAGRVSEELNGQHNLNARDLDRSIMTYKANFKVFGERILKRIRYDAVFGIDHGDYKMGNGKRNYLNFPFDAKIRFENKLDLIEFNAANKFTPYDLQSGTVVLQSYNRVIQGSTAYPLNQSKTRIMGLKYAHNDFLKMLSYGGSANYVKNIDQLKDAFVKVIGNGLQQYQLYAIPSGEQYSVEAYGAKTIFSAGFPIKLDLNFKYLANNSPVYIMGNLSSVKNKDKIIRAGLESNTSSPINIEINTKKTFSNINVDGNRYSSSYSTNNFLLKYRTKKNEATLTFLYNNDHIIGKKYIRRNFNLSLKRTIGKTILGVEAENFDDIFKIFDNTAYNSILNFQNGINTVTVRNMAISYIMFTIKQNF